MPSKITMKLSCDEELSFQMMSLFHGALMEMIPSEYASYLHQDELHPYTQHLERRDGVWYWVVAALHPDADRFILKNTLMMKDQVYLEKKDLKVDLTEKTYEEFGDPELSELFYSGEGRKYVAIRFLTPTAFKRQGRYLFYPDLFCIYQSLMNKYDVSHDKTGMIDGQTLETLVNESEIIRYDLRSVYYHLEGVKIPSFVGKITIKIKGTRTMQNFAYMLLKFGTFAGVGVKTALGMGAFEIIERGREKS